MSHGSASSRRNSRPAQQTQFIGLPTWSGISIIFAGLITGLLISLMNGNLGLPYQLAFIITAIGVILLVESRGLFLSVAAIPLLFGIVTPATAWLVAQQGIGNSRGFSTTAILSAIYPLAEFFPTLIMVTLVSALIAVVRIILLRRSDSMRQRSGEQVRRAQREADIANTTAVRRARAQTTRTRSRRAQANQESNSKQVTVDELIRKSQERRQHISHNPSTATNKPDSDHRHRSYDDDLYNQN